MKKEKREELKKRILENKLNDDSLRESIFANRDANTAKYNTYISISEMYLGGLLTALGIATLVFIWPIGLLIAVPTFFASTLCGLASHEQLKGTKKYGKRYGLNLRETFKSFTDKELFELMATNKNDLLKEKQIPETPWEPGQPIYSLSNEELLGKQTINEAVSQENKEQPTITNKETETQDEELERE